MEQGAAQGGNAAALLYVLKLCYCPAAFAANGKEKDMIRDFIADVVNFFIGLLDTFLGIFGIDI